MHVLLQMCQTSNLLVSTYLLGTYLHIIMTNWFSNPPTSRRHLHNTVLQNPLKKCNFMETALLDPYINAKTNKQKRFYIKTKKLAPKAGESEMIVVFIYCNFFWKLLPHSLTLYHQKLWWFIITFFMNFSLLSSGLYGYKW